jgi:hypothetical protein
MTTELPSMLDSWESPRAPWRKLFADPHQLTTTQFVLWMLYTPVRAVRDRLIPRGSTTYPPATRAGRARDWGTAVPLSLKRHAAVSGYS